MRIANLFGLRDRVWSTRDACVSHFPQRCPLDCPNAGKHDADIGNLCECALCMGPPYCLRCGAPHSGDCLRQEDQ